MELYIFNKKNLCCYALTTVQEEIMIKDKAMAVKGKFI